MEKNKKRYNIKTEMKNRVIIEEINPGEITEVWDKLKELGKSI